MSDPSVYFTLMQSNPGEVFNIHGRKYKKFRHFAKEIMSIKEGGQYYHYMDYSLQRGVFPNEDEVISVYTSDKHQKLKGSAYNGSEFFDLVKQGSSSQASARDQADYLHRKQQDAVLLRLAQTHTESNYHSIKTEYISLVFPNPPQVVKEDSSDRNQQPEPATTYHIVDIEKVKVADEVATTEEVIKVETEEAETKEADTEEVEAEEVEATKEADTEEVEAAKVAEALIQETKDIDEMAALIGPEWSKQQHQTIPCDDNFILHMFLDGYINPDIGGNSKLVLNNFIKSTAISEECNQLRSELQNGVLVMTILESIVSNIDWKKYDINIVELRKTDILKKDILKDVVQLISEEQQLQNIGNFIVHGGYINQEGGHAVGIRFYRKNQIWYCNLGSGCEDHAWLKKDMIDGNLVEGLEIYAFHGSSSDYDAIKYEILGGILLSTLVSTVAKVNTLWTSKEALEMQRGILLATMRKSVNSYIMQDLDTLEIGNANLKIKNNAFYISSQIGGTCTFQSIIWLLLADLITSKGIQVAMHVERKIRYYTINYLMEIKSHYYDRPNDPSTPIAILRSLRTVIFRPYMNAVTAKKIDSVLLDRDYTADGPVIPRYKHFHEFDTKKPSGTSPYRLSEQQLVHLKHILSSSDHIQLNTLQETLRLFKDWHSMLLDLQNSQKDSKIIDQLLPEMFRSIHFIICFKMETILQKLFSKEIKLIDIDLGIQMMYCTRDIAHCFFCVTASDMTMFQSTRKELVLFMIDLQFSIPKEYQLPTNANFPESISGLESFISTTRGSRKKSDYFAVFKYLISLDISQQVLGNLYSILEKKYKALNASEDPSLYSYIPDKPDLKNVNVKTANFETAIYMYQQIPTYQCIAWMLPFYQQDCGFKTDFKPVFVRYTDSFPVVYSICELRLVPSTISIQINFVSELANISWKWNKASDLIQLKLTKPIPPDIGAELELAEFIRTGDLKLFKTVTSLKTNDHNFVLPRILSSIGSVQFDSDEEILFTQNKYYIERINIKGNLEQIVNSQLSDAYKLEHVYLQLATVQEDLFFSLAIRVFRYGFHDDACEQMCKLDKYTFFRDMSRNFRHQINREVLGLVNIFFKEDCGGFRYDNILMEILTRIIRNKKNNDQQDSAEYLIADTWLRRLSWNLDNGNRILERYAQLLLSGYNLEARSMLPNTFDIVKNTFLDQDVISYNSSTDIHCTLRQNMIQLTSSIKIKLKETRIRLVMPEKNSFLYYIGGTITLSGVSRWTCTTLDPPHVDVAVIWQSQRPLFVIHGTNLTLDEGEFEVIHPSEAFSKLFWIQGWIGISVLLLKKYSHYYLLFLTGPKSLYPETILTEHMSNIFWYQQSLDGSPVKFKLNNVTSFFEPQYFIVPFDALGLSLRLNWKQHLVILYHAILSRKDRIIGFLSNYTMRPPAICPENSIHGIYQVKLQNLLQFSCAHPFNFALKSDRISLSQNSCARTGPTVAELRYVTKRINPPPSQDLVRLNNIDTNKLQDFLRSVINLNVGIQFWLNEMRQKKDQVTEQIVVAATKYREQALELRIRIQTLILESCITANLRYDLVIALLYQSKHGGGIRELCALDGILHMCDRIINELGRDKDPEVLIDLASQVDEQVVFSLQSPLDFPDIVFQLATGKRIKQEQYKFMLQSYESAISPDFSNKNEKNRKKVVKVMQAIMGIGKTSVIIPLLSLRLMQTPVLICQPSALIRQSDMELSAIYPIYMHRSCHMFQSSKQAQVLPSAGGSGLWIMSDDDLKNIVLTSRCSLAEPNKLDFFRRYHVLYDEVDSLWNPLRCCLNIPSGPTTHPRFGASVRTFFGNVDRVCQDQDLSRNEQRCEKTIQKEKSSAAGDLNAYTRDELPRAVCDARKLNFNCDYGLSSKELGRLSVIVPYQMLHVPLDDAQYMDVNLTAILTCLQVHQNGVSDVDIIQLRLLLDKWVMFVPICIQEQLGENLDIRWTDLKYADVDTVRKLAAQNHKLLSFILINVILPSIPYFKSQLNISFTDIFNDDFTYHRLGLSGTMNIEFQGEDIEICISQDGNQAIQNAIENRCSIKEFKSWDTIPWDKYDCLIDSMAYLKSQSSKEVVEYVKSKSDSKIARSYVYITRNHEPVNLLDGEMYRPDGVFNKESKPVFVFFDQAHCVGTDILLSPSSKALCVVNIDSRLSVVAQALYRLRKINSTQSADFLVINNHNKSIHIRGTQELYQILERNDAMFLKSLKGPAMLQRIKSQIRIFSNHTREYYLEKPNMSFTEMQAHFRPMTMKYPELVPQFTDYIQNESMMQVANVEVSQVTVTAIAVAHAIQIAPCDHACFSNFRTAWSKNTITVDAFTSNTQVPINMPLKTIQDTLYKMGILISPGILRELQCRGIKIGTQESKGGRDWGGSMLRVKNGKLRLVTTVEQLAVNNVRPDLKFISSSGYEMDVSRRENPDILLGILVFGGYLSFSEQIRVMRSFADADTLLSFLNCCYQLEYIDMDSRYFFIKKFINEKLSIGRILAEINSHLSDKTIWQYLIPDLKDIGITVNDNDPMILREITNLQDAIS